MQRKVSYVFRASGVGLWGRREGRRNNLNESLGEVKSSLSSFQPCGHVCPLFTA